MLTQAFIHSSWVYENSRLAEVYGQQDNAQLARLGSEILDLLVARSLAQEVLQRKVPDNWFFLTLLAPVMGEAFDQTDLSNLALLGRGQALTGLSTDMKSNILQALVAVLYLTLGGIRPVESSWPDRYFAVMEAVSPFGVPEHDLLTHFDYLASTTGLVVGLGYEEQGLDHEVRYRCTIQLTSANMSGAVKVAGPWAKTKKLRDAFARRG